MKSMNTVVRGVLARNTHRDGASIHAWHDLEHDLGLTRLQITRIALDVEDVTGIEITMNEIAHVRTVVDLATVFGSKSDREPRRQRFDRVA